MLVQFLPGRLVTSSRSHVKLFVKKPIPEVLEPAVAHPGVGVQLEGPERGEGDVGLDLEVFQTVVVQHHSFNAATEILQKQ